MAEHEEAEPPKGGEFFLTAGGTWDAARSGGRRPSPVDDDAPREPGERIIGSEGRAAPAESGTLHNADHSAGKADGRAPGGRRQPLPPLFRTRMCRGTSRAVDGGPGHHGHLHQPAPPRRDGQVRLVPRRGRILEAAMSVGQVVCVDTGKNRARVHWMPDEL